MVMGSVNTVQRHAKGTTVAERIVMKMIAVSVLKNSLEYRWGVGG